MMSLIGTFCEMPNDPADVRQLGKTGSVQRGVKN